MKEIDVEWARATFDYNPETGAIVRKSNGLSARKIATGGRAIVYSGQTYFIGARLAWALHHGETPQLDVVCANGDEQDLSIGNLRLATGSDRAAKCRLRQDNRSGTKGVWWDRDRKRWRVMVQRDGTNHYVGRFTDYEEACEAYRIAAAKLHGEFANDGRGLNATDSVQSASGP